MKIYVCYLLEECEGTYSHATTMSKPTALNFDDVEKPIMPHEAWIAFGGEDQAKKWVREQEDKFNGLPYFYGAAYREVDFFE